MRRNDVAIRAAAALVAALTGCVPKVQSAVFISAPPAAADHDVRIYRTQMPACPYDEVGIVTWPGGSRKMQIGVERMRTRAREMGGDAIVGFSMGEHATGTSTTVSADSAHVTATSSIDVESTLSGTVIRFRDPGCTK